MGLLSPGGVHSHLDHILAMIEFAAQRGAKKIYLHAFLDGRDTPPKSAMESIQKVEALFKKLGVGEIASIVGRYYAMDRDNRWERVKEAYDLLTLGSGLHAESTTHALQAAYDRGETDEFVKATTIGAIKKLEDGDSLIFMNFRSDRARELSRALMEKDFDGFLREKLVNISYATLTQYHEDFKFPIAFPPQNLEHLFGQVISQAGLKQLRLAETEKYAHVTFFFNGGTDEPSVGEDRLLIPSVKVATYDLQPEMSAPEITKALVQAIESQKYEVTRR
jgi:2,3-bisphosphoglycerate-independent phosphoglycerate mutase